MLSLALNIESKKKNVLSIKKIACCCTKVSIFNAFEYCYLSINDKINIFMEF